MQDTCKNYAETIAKSHKNNILVECIFSSHNNLRFFSFSAIIINLYSKNKVHQQLMAVLTKLNYLIQRIS